MLSNCTNSYVKNKKTITSPDDLMKFTNVWCEKQKQTNNTIKMCGQGWSKDLNISESKAIIPLVRLIKMLEFCVLSVFIVLIHSVH